MNTPRISLVRFLREQVDLNAKGAKEELKKVDKELTAEEKKQLASESN